MRGDADNNLDPTLAVGSLFLIVLNRKRGPGLEPGVCHKPRIWSVQFPGVLKTKPLNCLALAEPLNPHIQRRGAQGRARC